MNSIINTFCSFDTHDLDRTHKFKECQPSDGMVMANYYLRNLVMLI